MLEALYRDLDVFILDRGIFDALVWNEWLEMTGKITSEEARQVAEFFSMERWTSLTDLVFVLTCDPKVSIEREYGGSTDHQKRGTIMAEETLSQFLQSFSNETLRKNSGKFRKIVSIDTTTTRTQQGVAKIADEALTVLNAFLDESICVVPVASLKVTLPDHGFISDPSTITGFIDSIKESKAFTPRSDAEQNQNCIQPGSLVLCFAIKKKVLLLRRKKPGHPLHDKYDVWAGGHVSQTDDGADILLNTLYRELAEEVFIKEAFELSPNPIGLSAN